MKEITADTPIGDIRRVVMYFYDTPTNSSITDSTEHFVHKDDLDVFIEAIVKLHVNPGINPHALRYTPSLRADKRNTSPVRAIQVYKWSPKLAGVVWWSRPSLDANSPDEGDGATVIAFDDDVASYDYPEFHPDKTEEAALRSAGVWHPVET